MAAGRMREDRHSRPQLFSWRRACPLLLRNGVGLKCRKWFAFLRARGTRKAPGGGRETRARPGYPFEQGDERGIGARGPRSTSSEATNAGSPRLRATSLWGRGAVVRGMRQTPGAAGSPAIARIGGREACARSGHSFGRRRTACCCHNRRLPARATRRTRDRRGGRDPDSEAPPTSQPEPRGTRTKR